jgi:magnesium-transporting ATPase (P-type)
VRELVPGDVIELKGGDVIPADAKVSTSNTLQISSNVVTPTIHQTRLKY